jgi:hypothetical protein
MNDLNDSLDGLFGGAPAGATPRPAPRLPDHYVSPVERIVKTYREGCGRCGGSGQTRWGTCFRCKGAGGKTYKTSPEQRRANRENAAARKQRGIEEARATFAAAWPAEWAWMNAKANSFDFARSMLEAIDKFDTLTERQLAAVQKCIQRDKERAAEREAAKAAAPTVDVSKIEEAFARVRGDAAKDGEGVKWLKLFIGDFKFLDAPASNGYAAAILVRRGNEKLGRIVKGRFERNRFACDDATAAQVVEVLADPGAAARAYGQRTGICCICAAELTNADSRAAGIGPICAKKWGF